MTRQYATFDCGMWDDPDGFASLSAGAQRTYFMLVTQKDITACGSLALTLRRWGATCSDDDLKSWLEELVERRYILIDEVTEEVLVRTFMKWDAGYRHAKRVLAVIASAKAIRSLSIRGAAVAELARLGVSIPNPLPPDRQSIPNPEGIELLRSVVTEVSTDHTPHSSLLEGGTGATDASAGPPSMFCKKHPNGTDEPCGACARAREAYKAHMDRTLTSQIDAKRAQAEARTACDLCDEKGMRLDPETRKPAGRCDHRRTA